MDEILEIIKKAREEKGMNQTEVAKKLGLGLRQYQNIESGIFPKYKRQQISDLEKILDISIYEDIYAEKAPRGTEKTSYLDDRRKLKLSNTPFMVPLVPVKAQAGYVKNFDNTDFINSLELYPIVPGIDPRGTTWRYFEVDGESMRDTLDPGDIILSNFVPSFDWTDFKQNYIYIIISGTGTTPYIKRIKRKNDKEWILKSDNKEFPNTTVKVEDVLEVWKARRKVSADLGPIKKTKHYDLD